ncbi:hypothetical protein PCASD_03011 [Puccinia coronata f. sp. avenae]|uniref:Uncharacterized protein n=1 Tax=Puccinia coronata f. sp. avenae TaxID=200324 RepID=A0A2N5VH17_9BASI|nr:hypothetical protein PCASD_03011 [Puccinia coronata f. sp. avenae]
MHSSSSRSDSSSHPGNNRDPFPAIDRRGAASVSPRTGLSIFPVDSPEPRAGLCELIGSELTKASFELSVQICKPKRHIRNRCLDGWSQKSIDSAGVRPSPLLLFCCVAKNLPQTVLYQPNPS